MPKPPSDPLLTVRAAVILLLASLQAGPPGYKVRNLFC